MRQIISCGGVVIFKGKILLLYKKYKKRYDGWVLPKGTVEAGEEFEETAFREVREESGVFGRIVKYIGSSNYSFNVPDDVVEKNVHWYLMQTDSFSCHPQREEDFYDAGFYKFHEAFHLLKFGNERKILERAYKEYQKLKRECMWNDQPIGIR